jgi:two-component system, OmpR family, sensor kinase
VSLRGRLLLATVILVAIGLLVADAATYGLLRSSLIGRIDRQLHGGGEVAGRFVFEPGTGKPGPGDGFGEHGGERHAPPQTQVIERLDASGNVIASSSGPFGFSQSPPVLPSNLPGSTANVSDRERLFSTGSQDGSVRYRVLAVPFSGGGGTLVLAFPLGDAEDALNTLLLIEGIVTVLALAAVAGLALWLVRLGLRPLTQMEVTAAEIAAGDLSRRVSPAGDRTEVGRLGRALNAMMERIESAFAERRASEDRLRRFVADASHELRTPLTSIRGYAELFRHGADQRPEDLAKSMRRIEEESARMGVLVEELLLLARLDQRPELERSPVDLAAVATDAVSDARAVGNGRPIELATDGPVVVQGDDARLRQVAANLLANALTHTPPDTPVRVRVGSREGEATLEVADEGPGMTAEEAGHVFDRFYRVDDSRSRDGGGAGLGLSIVAAIVEAHGGRVSLDTAPGRGARFTVTLPQANS